MAGNLNARSLLTEAKKQGFVFQRAGTLNSLPAYRLVDAGKHGYATDPFGRSAALFSKSGIARLLGYQV